VSRLAESEAAHMSAHVLRLVPRAVDDDLDTHKLVALAKLALFDGGTALALKVCERVVRLAEQERLHITPRHVPRKRATQ
jgi:hypothetical protein